MQELNYADVCKYIDNNFFNTEEWQVLSVEKKQRAINQSKRVLSNMFEEYYKGDIPLEHLAEQTNWTVRLDNIVLKGEMGVTSISIEGINVNLSEKNNFICPFILNYFRLPTDWIESRKRKVGSYTTDLTDTFRKGWC